MTVTTSMRSHVWGRFGRTAAVVCTAAVGVTGLSLAAAPSMAAPSNAPTSLVGTFDCGGGNTGSFVVNTGKSNSTTWSPAFLTLSSGRGMFVPTELHLTFTFGGQTGHEDNVKGGGHPVGLTTCTIAAGQDGFSLSGTVVGTLVLKH